MRYAEKFREILTAEMRKGIHQAAIALIREEGLESFTTEKIAERLGVSRGVLYNYYENKEAILQSVLHELFEGTYRKLEEAAGGGRTASERLERMAQIAVVDFMEQHQFRRALMGKVPPPGKKEHPMVQGHLRKNALFERVICSGVEAGEFRELDAKSAALLLAGGLQEMSIMALFTEEEPRPLELIRIFVAGAQKRD